MQKRLPGAKSGAETSCTVIKSRIFLDTNILVYTLDNHDIEKQHRARRIVKNVIECDFPVISTQVIQEFYSASVKKLGVDPLVAKNIVHSLGRMDIISVGLDNIEQGIDISIVYCLSFWDGLIIASAEAANCSLLFSEDLNDGQIIRGVKIVNPFLHS